MWSLFRFFLVNSVFHLTVFKVYNNDYFVYNLITIMKLSAPNEGIHEINPFGSCFYKWEAVESVEDNCGDVYIFLDKLAGFIIPSDAFESQIEEEKLISILHCKISKNDPNNF